MSLAPRHDPAGVVLRPTTVASDDGPGGFTRMGDRAMRSDPISFRSLSPRAARLAGRCGAGALLLLIGLVNTGCAGGGADVPPPPVGAGAAAEMDLTPWLDQAVPFACTGWLEEFYVHPFRERGVPYRGTYLTWAIHPAPPYIGAELDVRRCPPPAHLRRWKVVEVHGRLIERAGHLPLLVVEWIEPRPVPGQGPPLALDPR